MLLELNIEQTRHNEIQILGNGEWCIVARRPRLLAPDARAEAGRGLGHAGRPRARRSPRPRAAERRPRRRARSRATSACSSAWRRRPSASARAVKLDSASTFECIVDGDRHYFMEVNTRIQVEHRVSELCYALRFTNPDDPADHFDVHSLVEAMALIAKHKRRLPQPTRVRRDGAAIEARLNATDRALKPAAGGVIVSWSDPIAGEIRDDQGICIKNPDTGLFMRYRLAGAYDSNVALLLADRRRPRARAGSGSSRSSAAPRSAASTSRPTSSSTTASCTWFLAPRPVGEADDQVRRAVPDAGRRARAGGAARSTSSTRSSRSRARAHRRGCARGARSHAPGARAQGDAARAADPLPVRRAALPLRLALAAPARLRRARRPRRAGSGTRSRCWPRRIACSHLDTPSDAAAAHRIWDHDRDAARHGARVLRQRCERAAPAGIAWPELDATLRDERRRPSASTTPRWDARPRGARRPPARPRDPGAAAADRREGRLLRPAARRRPDDR